MGSSPHCDPVKDKRLQTMDGSMDSSTETLLNHQATTDTVPSTLSLNKQAVPLCKTNAYIYHSMKMTNFFYHRQIVRGCKESM